MADRSPAPIPQTRATLVGAHLCATATPRRTAPSPGRAQVRSYRRTAARQRPALRCSWSGS